MWRRGRKWSLMGPKGVRNCWACSGDLKRWSTRSRRRVGRCEFSMLWSQNPVSAGQATERDDVADLHGGSIDYHTVDEQLYERAALFGGRVVEPRCERHTEGFDS